tara:strand:+ start:1086 stop:1664 length:579 start_codon:yes stop_codon:yes gene_type:complete
MKSLDAECKHSGFTLIELLVALVVLLVGVMGAAGLMVRTVQQEVEAYQRLQALNILQDMVDRIDANKAVASCYSYGVNGATFGTGITEFEACAIGSADHQARVAADIQAWHLTLIGVAEQDGSGNSMGAMIGARSCVVQLSAIDQTYRVTVAWQGLNDTVAAPSGNLCGKNQFGSESQRRTVSTIVRVGDLS